jgi:riboflavin kinase/FMN adenylyltransferase
LREARSSGLKSVAYTFWPHPRRFFHPQSQDPKLIFSLDEKIELLKLSGFDFVINQSFTDSFSKLEAKDFAEKIKTFKKRLASLKPSDNGSVYKKLQKDLTELRDANILFWRSYEHYKSKNCLDRRI